MGLERGCRVEGKCRAGSQHCWYGRHGAPLKSEFPCECGLGCGLRIYNLFCNSEGAASFGSKLEVSTRLSNVSLG